MAAPLESNQASNTVKRVAEPAFDVNNINDNANIGTATEDITVSEDATINKRQDTLNGVLSLVEPILDGVKLGEPAHN